MKYFIFIVLSLVFSSSASAALTTVPLRQVWSLSTDDVVSVNTSTRIATATAYVPNASGTIYRIKATTNGVRLLTIAEEAAVGGKGNPWLTAALAAGYLTYEGYQWYKTEFSGGLAVVGTCAYSHKVDVSLSDCISSIKSIINEQYVYSGVNQIHFVFDNVTSVKSDLLFTKDGSDFYSYNLTIYYKYPYCSNGNCIFYDSSTTSIFNENELIQTTSETKKPVTDEQVTDELLASLSGSSSRQAFSDASQPYPLDGLFTDSDLSVDPTYSPQADITTENLPDYITKYNNNTLQTTDPSLSNYVTPAQYQYIKSQAEQAAATAAGGSPSTNPLEGMEQPITQKQYDESNLKSVEAEAAALTATKPALQTVLDKFNADKQFMVDQMAKPTAPPVAMPDFFGWAWPTGSCSGFELDFNIHVPFIGVQSIYKVVNEYCKPYIDYVHPVFFWFFNLSTLFYIFRLWDRTAIDVAKI